MKKSIIVILGAALSTTSFAAEIPACLNGVVNQVSVCKEKIENEIAVAEKTVNKNKENKLHYGQTLSFPTMVDGKTAILSLTETNKGVTQVMLFNADISRGLFWKKQCSLTVINSSTIPSGTEKDFLSKTFNCQ